MTALAIPLFMIAASRWLWPGFWLNAAVSVSLGSFIFVVPARGYQRGICLRSYGCAPGVRREPVQLSGLRRVLPADARKGRESPTDLREGLWPRREARLLGAPLALVGAHEG